MAEITITNNTLSYRAQVFQIRNIAQVHHDSWQRKPLIGNAGLAILLILSGLLCIVDPLFFQTLSNKMLATNLAYPPLLYIFSGVGAFGVFLYGLWDRGDLDRTTLCLETNAGKSALFSSPDGAGVKRIAAALRQVMEDPDAKVSYLSRLVGSYTHP